MVIGEPLLSDLCGICHTNAPKYTCPGCTARTCSLPCVKKHKQRASCSGKRDPTKYVKSSQLLTAAGIDHDYNFISGIERDIAKKDQSSFDRKSIRDGQQAPVAHVQRNQRFLNRLQETKVMVEKAPTGMARQRQNRTRALKGGHNKELIWTVEWIHADQSRSIDDEVRDTRSFAEAYYLALRKHRNKRSLEDANLDTVDHTKRAQTKKQRQEKLADGLKERSSPCELGSAKSTLEGSVAAAAAAAEHTAEMKHRGGLPDGSSNRLPEFSQDDDSRGKKNNVDTKGGSKMPQTQPTDKEHHFYLVRPHCSSDRPVLIPLDRNSCLFESLANQVVREFPTIQALKHSPESLPEEFILEKDYFDQLKKEQEEIDRLLAHTVDGAAGSNRQRDKEEEDDWDEKKILDVLKKDTMARTRA